MNENDERPGNGGEQPSTPGRMRFQDRSTAPREPSLAERRYRERRARQEQQAVQRRLAQMERDHRRRRLLGTGAKVTLGIVALVALGYLVSDPEEEVVAHCVDENDIVVDDSNCVTPASSSSGNYYYTGGGFYPIFIGGDGRQYHYRYGGTGTVGQRIQGGTTVVPKEGTRVTTSSGKTITRGGLGVSGSGSSGS